MNGRTRFLETDAYREGLEAVRRLDAELQAERAANPPSETECAEAAAAFKASLERHVHFMETFTPYLQSLRSRR
ncbi:MAG: hypothetical protein ACRDHF_13185 [Tepidiformaceae bacterium]